MECNDKNMYQSLNWCQGKPVYPGIRSKAYYIPKRSIVKFPVLPDEVAKDGTLKDLVTYKEDFILAADTKWLELDIITKESPVTSEAQGEMPCVTSLNKVTFKYPSVEEEATAFARQANNDDLIYLFQQRNGKFRVIGNEMFNTTTKVKQENGAAETDKAGTTIEVEVTDVCPAPFYVGKIETEAGDISGADGSVVPEVNPG